MAYLAKGNKPDLLSICEEMGVEEDQSSKVVDIKKLILNREFYVEEEVKIILDRVISDRKEQERSKQEEKEREERSKREEREREERMAREARQHELELRKLELSQQNQPLNDESGRRVEIGPKNQLTQITTKFDEGVESMGLERLISFRDLYLLSFRIRKAELAQVPKKDWVAYLLAVLPAELSNMLAREPTERANNYDFVKDLILKRTVIHDSTGFSPAELVHGKNIRTPVMLLYEKLTEEEHVESSVVDYVYELINRMKRCQELAILHMEDAKQKQKLWYDRRTVKRQFQLGELVLVIAPSRSNKLSVQWVGPGDIVQQLSETNYVVKFPEKDKTHVYHVNMLKPYHQREENTNLLCINPLKHDKEEDIPSLELENERSGWSKIISDVQLNSKLSQIQRGQLKELLYKYKVNTRLELKIIEPGESDFTSPLILVEAQGKEARLCIDYRRLNKVTRTLFFPLPNIEELLEKVSAAKCISILDLTRVYWQIPLIPRAQRYASFVTTFGTFKPLRLPYGLKNAPYYFSRLMANLLRNCEDFAVPYLDHIAIFSLAWDDHLKHLKDVFDRLRSAKLHIKPSKCQFAQAYVKYLGHLVGQGLRTPGELKVQVIKDFPIPTNKTQVRAFLGLSGYYRRYIPEFFQ
ncbi:hypothetical protein TNCV_487581 [Trichonephila clavipes]|nr:hypothetical protein TNCV_487581 [Trichonephila clavipes]